MKKLLVTLILLVVILLLVSESDGWRRRRRRRRRVNCGYNNWGGWSRCNGGCYRGTQYRRRYIYRWPCCGGWGCPSTYTWRYCGSYNGGCQQRCTGSGYCSCYSGYWKSGSRCYDTNECKSSRTCNQICYNTVGSYYCRCYFGYYLATRNRCDRVSCGKPRLPSCPGGSYKDSFGDACKSVTVPSCGNLYKDYCYPGCSSSNYKLATYSGSGAFMGDYSRVKFESISRVQCQGNKVWTDAYLLSRLYCRRVNDPPSRLSMSSYTLNENSAVGTKVGTLMSSDPQSSQTHTYTMRTGTANTGYYLFRISGSGVYSRWVPKLNVPGGIVHSSFVITVRTTDNGIPNMWREQSFTIRINNVNDPPQDIKLTPWALKENVAIGTRVGYLSAYDPDVPTDTNPCANWILRDSDNGFFSLSGNQILVAKSLNHEAQSFHSIAVICTDKQRGSVSTSQVLVIDVQDAQDPPISIALDKTNVDENSKVGTLVGTATALDEDDEALTISMYPTSAYFSVGATTCVDVSTPTHIHRQQCTAPLTVATAKLNWELRSWYSLTLYARDSSPSHLHKALWVNVTVNNLNEQPTAITIATPTVSENSPGGSQVSDLNVVDPDNEVQLVQKPTCVLGTGADNAQFEIEGTSPNYDLILAKTTTVNYEKKKSYAITVTCNDHGLPEKRITRSFTITVTDVNETPDGVSLSATSIDENSALGTVVGTLSASDPDTSPQTFTYTLLPSGGQDLPFKITGNKLIVNSSIDFETRDAYTLSISVDDQGGLEYIGQIDLNVTDVPEGPTSVTLDGAHTMPENSGEGTLVGNIIVVDQDFNQLPTCAVEKDYSNGALEVDGTGGDELVAGKRMVDFETEGTMPLRISIKCTDSDGLSKTSTFSVMITDVNEAPTNITLSSNTVPENTAPYIVGQLTVVDPDAGQTHNCSIQDNTGASAAGQVPETQLFKVTKTLQLQVIKPLDYEGGVDTYSVHVLCSDIPTNPNQTSYVIEEDLIIQVINKNEPPASPCIGAMWSVSENAASGVAVTGQLTASDTEANQMLTFSLANAGTVPFYINQSSMAIFTTGGLDFETTTFYDLRVTVTDDGNLEQVATSASTTSTPASATYTCRVNVLDANDPHSSIDVTVTPPSPCVDEHLAAGSVVATLNTTDQDKSAKFTYTISPDDGPFEIKADQIVVNGKAAAQIDWETGLRSVVVTITSTDETGFSVNRLVTICVKNVNENATKICLVKNTIKENVPGVATIGQIIVEDPDLPIRTCGPPPQPHSQLPTNYSCIIDDNTAANVYEDKFQISKKLLLEQKGPLNFEAGKQYLVPVLCHDILAPFNTIATRFTIIVLDVAEPPQNIAPLTTGMNMPYNATASVVTVAVPERQSDITLLTLTCTDPDYPGAAPQVTYTATGEGVPAFMEMQNNQLVLLNAFDYETKKRFVLNVQVTDNEGKSASIQVVINVADTNDLPTQINLVCQNGALFPFANTTARPASSTGTMASTSLNITAPTWPSSIITHPGIANTAEDCSVLTAGVTMPGSVIGEVYPQDQDSQKWYTFMLLGANARYFSLYPYGVMAQNKYTHSALILVSPGVDMFNLTNGNPTYDVYVDVYDNYGMQQVGHIVHIRTKDACMDGASDCVRPTSCVPSKWLGKITCSCPRGSVGDGVLTSAGGTGCKACKAGELPDSSGVCRQVDECATKPCNNGACIDGVFSYTCNCAIGYTGTHCETNLEGCAQNKGICLNGGACVDSSAAALTCTCEAGYTGHHCEYLTSACTDFPVTCEDDTAKYCALTPHVDQLESSPLCVTNVDMVHAIITGVPTAADISSLQFVHVTSSFIDEVLGNEQFMLLFDNYASSQLGLTSRTRRSTTYTQTAQKPYLTQVINITAIAPGTILVSFTVLSRKAEYRMTNAFDMCPKFVTHTDIRCVGDKDCPLVQKAQFVCNSQPLSAQPVHIQNAAVLYIQTYNKTLTKVPLCSSGRAPPCDNTPTKEAQINSISTTSFWSSGPGIAIIAVCVATLVIVACIVAYFYSGKKKIKSRYEQRQLMEDDTVSTASSVAVGHSSIQQTRGGFSGVKNPLFEGAMDSAATESRENAVYDSADVPDVQVDNSMYDSSDGAALYEELPN